MAKTFTRTERYPKSTDKKQLEKNCVLLKKAGAVSCQIIEQSNSWIVATEWKQIPPGNPAFEKN